MNSIELRSSFDDDVNNQATLAEQQNKKAADTFLSSSDNLGTSSEGEISTGTSSSGEKSSCTAAQQNDFADVEQYHNAELRDTGHIRPDYCKSGHNIHHENDNSRKTIFQDGQDNR